MHVLCTTANILSERDCMNDIAVEAVVHGASIFKSENTLTKVLDHIIYKVFWGYSAT